MNQLSKRDEILLILQEECAEVIQAVSKVKRFGMANNQEQLEQEIADVLCMINLCYEYKIISSNKEEVDKRINKKEERLKKYSNIYNSPGPIMHMRV